ncbi:transglycosylase domain-containing protein [Hydrogenophaga sp. OTU3427]|uniref:transglycosylase domain-containing protein n=1 Tax=Hydrogenophaga sp. OTU3427 TaxID=3043856 RepID=UPI00313B9250
MRAVLRWLLWMLAALVALQVFFIGRIALMAVVDPQSTAFMRSEAWRLAVAERGLPRWRQQWVDYGQISPHLKRAVMASEDAAFNEHNGVDWDAIESAREKNAKRAELAEQRAARAKNPATVKPPKVVGGSTITQQLAKNLLLSGERNLLRKGQEFVLTLALEALLDKRRILEIYLNSVEWGEGVFGAEAASQRYFRKSVRQLAPSEAARLAVMLPSPKFFESRPGSPYLAGRAATITARMGAVQAP